jgi:hypothetical protein
MKNTSPRKIVASVSLDINGREARIEKLLTAENAPAEFRIAASQPGPLVLTEDQLIELLHKASHAGVLPKDFVGKLRAKIEI